MSSGWAYRNALFSAAALPDMEEAARRIFRRDARADRPELSRRTANEIGAECRDILQRSIEATDDPALDPETVRQRASGSLDGADRHGPYAHGRDLARHHRALTG